MKPILVIGIGNDARGDDALGPLLLRRLAEEDFPECEFLEVYQLQIEHTLDLAGRQQVLFIDAGMNTPAPFTLNRIGAGDSVTPYTHALSPTALLNVCRQINVDAPEAYALCIRGEQFNLGLPLSRPAQNHLETACAFIRPWLLRHSHRTACPSATAPAVPATTSCGDGTCAGA